MFVHYNFHYCRLSEQYREGYSAGIPLLGIRRTSHCSPGRRRIKSPDWNCAGLPFSKKESAPVSAEDAPKPERTVSSESKAVPLDAFRTQKELKSLFFIAEQYLGKTLTRTDVDTITYFYETLHMSADLIEYLIETCVENGHKSMHYIQKVAFSWVEEGIQTVSQAKEQSMLYSRNCYTVLNAFGIKNRGPAASELTYIKKWAEEYGFSSEIIQEACRPYDFCNPSAQF